ncbi:CRISPR-associated helicase Cas3' [uncultured Clostridium sp.]|uniref:CRISPR-associated helicase Cas3' n=1 Tax=uncultured Clostridium sp. TaxID=59620 RepID=UPI0026DB3D6D|nr:CRISPR-associated helicase Cas3' [uncultured Clostridium sp.]
MCTSFKLKSHIYENKSSQLLVEHLRGVARIAKETSQLNGIDDKEIMNVIEILGLCHDFGKASSYFQKYLEGKYNGDLKKHGEISAYFTYYMLPERWKLIGFICVKRHHGNIDIENNSFFATENEEVLKEISKDIKNNIEELKLIYKCDLEKFFSKMGDGTLIKEVKLAFIKRTSTMKRKTIKEQQQEFMWLQYLWSLLLTGDKTQLITGKTFKNIQGLSERFTLNYKNNIRKSLIERIPDIEKSPLFNIREEIYDSTISSINSLDIEKDRKLSINVPTGTGKTIAVYGAAFRLSERLIEEKGIVPNIIYNIPFMSVIDQNYDVLEEILTANEVDISTDLILKYHSMSPIEYKDYEEKEYKNYDARFLVENWQSTVITTTFVQLFNSIFKSGVNSIVHRFHKLAGSIVILDEVQAVPTKYYPIIEDLFNILCDNFNCYIITVTATKPLFLEGKELVINNHIIFKEMNRIIFENNTHIPLYLNEFKEVVLDDIKHNNDKSILIILNTVKSTLDVFDYLKAELGESRKIIYLSTEIIPKVRLEIIKEIKDSKDKYILISTQLIEAGVDLDFDIVYRDIAPMDCINQSAGRANRNGAKGTGIVKLYKLMNNNNKIFAFFVYSNSLLEATLTILKDKRVIEENELWEINNEYFAKVKEVTDNHSLEEYKTYCEYIKNLRLQDIRKFELIEENKNKIDVIIRYNDEVEKYINIIENSKDYCKQDVINGWRGLNKYKIAVNKEVVKDMVYEIKGSNFLNGLDYDKNRGIIRRSSVII